MGGNEPTPELINQLREEEVGVALTLSGLEWINIGNFTYYEPEIERIVPMPPFEKDLSEEEVNYFFDYKSLKFQKNFVTEFLENKKVVFRGKGNKPFRRL